MFSEEVCVILAILIGLFLGWKIFSKLLFPILVNKSTKDIEVNPEWITPKLREKYYGLHDIDIVLVDDPFGCIPRFRETKSKRLQLLISDDTSVKDIDDVARVALAGKLKLKYGIWFPDKPVFWLSILCYMLDGGDIHEEAVSWKEKEKDNKPIDDNINS